MLLDVSVFNPREIVFQGRVRNVILPGESGVFEILPFHKRLLSRLIAGKLSVGEESFLIKRGIVKVIQNKVTIIVEEK